MLVWLAAPQQECAAQDNAPRAPTGTEYLKRLSLEELMEISTEATGSLVPASPLKSAVAVTTITAEDIRLAPHRNLLDLIEVYVPGAMVFPHSEGRQLGIRGIISDRNLKFLVLVNGRVMNDRAHGGAYTEITNWDLNDIERVEVVRGPGSVTYGPGAIAGVINIITKTANDVQRPEAVVKYTHPYGSTLGSLSYVLRRKNFDLFAYVSAVHTEGEDNPRTFNMEGTLANGFGFIGTDDFTAGSPKSFPPHDYYSDFEDQPQYKAHLDMTFFKELRLWIRYTTSGGNMDQRVALTRYPQGLDASGTSYVFGPPSVSSEIQNRQLTVALENKHEVTDVLSIETTLSPQYQDFERRRRPQLGQVYPDSTPDELRERIGNRNSVWNKQSNFGEYDVLARVIAHLDFEKTKAALGYEYNFTHIGPKWGDSADELRMGDNLNYVSGPQSLAFTPFFDSVGLNPADFGGVGPSNAVFVGDGWSTHTHSLLGEVSFEQVSWLNVLLSGRIDHHRDTGLLYSPRVALLSEINRRNYLKLIAQESVRMNTGEQLLAAHFMDETSDPEKLRSLELIYETLPTDNLRLSLTSFYYELQANGFTVASTAGGTSGGVTSLGRTGSQGVQKTGGFEFDARYSGKIFTAGISHSYVKLLDFELADGINSSSISYSDYRVPILDGSGNVVTTLSSTGDDINNWSNHATKVYLDIKLLKNLTFHTDARVFWGYDGSKDMITMMERAIAAPGISDEQRNSVQNALNTLKDKDAYGLDFRLNASLTYDVNDRLSLSVFAQNLLGTGGNKRYQHDIGATTLVPRSFFTEEPRTFGMLVKMTF